MVGRDVELIVPKGPANPGEVVLSLHGVTGPRRPPGHGRQRRRPRGPGRRDRGDRGRPGQRPDRTRRGDRRASVRSTPARSTIGGQHIETSSPRQVSDLGVAHIPEDRGRDGLIAHMTVAENYILDTYHREPYSKRGIFDRKAVTGRCRQGRQGLRHPDAVDRHARRRHCRAATSRRSSSRASSRSRSSSSWPPSRRVAWTSARSSTSIGGSSSSAMPARRSSSSAPNSTRCSPSGDRIAVMYDGKIVGILSGDDATHENLGLLMGGADVRTRGGRVSRTMRALARRARPDPGGRHCPPARRRS